MSQTLRPFLLCSLLATALAVGACECDPKPTTDEPVTCADVPDGTACPENPDGVCCAGTCGTFTCEFAFEECLAPMCSDGTVTCECTTVPPAVPGRLADELDSTVQADGTVVLAGYLPGDPRGGAFRPRPYGDLVVGTFTSGSIDWEIIDGVPSGAEPTADPAGFRDGILESGPDVGRYPSIEAIMDNLAVAYGDDDTGSLKLAKRVDGTWTTSVIDANAGERVAWTSMALDANGLPVVSYLVVNKGGAAVADGGAVSLQPQSSLRIAHPTLPEDAGTADWTGAWTSYELLSAEMRCGAQLCGDGTKCVVAGGGTCTADTGDCGAEACASGSICFNGACSQVKNAEDYLVAAGTFNDIEQTATGMALVYYDRNTGDLYGRECTGACAAAADWTAPFLIDGWSGTRPGAGDCGIGASLSIDAAGVWHVTYVDGTNEELRYARIDGVAITYERIDDGTDGTTPDIDRAHRSFVGDDSAVTAVETAGGVEIRVAYADVTRLTTVLATRAPDGTWTHRELPQSAGRAGFSITQTSSVAEISHVGSMWYQATSDSAVTPFESDTDVFTLGEAPAAP